MWIAKRISTFYHTSVFLIVEYQRQIFMMFCLGLLDESLMCSLSNFSHCIDLSAWSISLVDQVGKAYSQVP